MSNKKKLICNIKNQVNDKDEEMQKLQAESQLLKEKEEKMRATLGVARTSLAEKNKQLEECKARNASLTEQCNKMSLSAGEQIRIQWSVTVKIVLK